MKNYVKDYEIQGFYSGAWETVSTYEMKKEALEDIKRYRENEPRYTFRLRVVRQEVIA